MTIQIPVAYVSITDAQTLGLDVQTVHRIIEMLQHPVSGTARHITAAPVMLSSDESEEPDTYQIPTGEAVLEAIEAEVSARVVGLISDYLPSGGSLDPLDEQESDWS